jgi:hypothetical protein
MLSAPRVTGPRVSARILGLRASAATGSPAAGRSRLVSRTAATARTVTHPARSTAVTATAAVEVRGHACEVRPCRTSLANLVPNGSVPPPSTQASSRAAAQIIPIRATSDQQPISTAHPAAAPPGAADGRGPSARLIA